MRASPPLTREELVFWLTLVGAAIFIIIGLRFWHK